MSGEILSVDDGGDVLAVEDGSKKSRGTFCFHLPGLALLDDSWSYKEQNFLGASRYHRPPEQVADYG